ncbi:MAG: class I SAM-dependent methyltransferase [Melioribacteraceae bacterium]|nr:class I SAM-dependent methyltransferase [Melioribacteraceae bacterium]
MKNEILLNQDTSRWNKAQEYEKNWWAERKDIVDFNFYKEFAGDMLNFISNHFEIKPETKILEIGSGAGGIITYLKQSENRYAIDPLEGFYSSVEEFSHQRDNNVKYFTAAGEAIPINDNYFDLVIMDNVLDHCIDPSKVMKEVSRVLKPKGFLYFKQNTYHLWGIFVRFLMEKMVIDKGHPHTFSKSDLKKFAFENNLTELKKTRSGYINTWVKEIKGAGLKNKLKAFLFVTRDKVTILYRKDK